MLISDPAPVNQLGRILVPCPANAGDPEMVGLHAAMDLANRCDGSVIAAFLRPDPTMAVSMVPADVGVPGMVSAAYEAKSEFEIDADAAKSLLARTVREFPRRARVGAQDADDAEGFVTFRSSFGRPQEAIVGLSRTCDCSIFTMSGGEGPDDMGQACLVESGRPVLFLPEDYDGGLARRVLIAWNGSVQAAQAVAASLGLLATAERVHIIQIGGPELPLATASELAEYLATHGIATSTELVPPNDEPVDKVLIAKAGEYGCDLIVQGAYSHSRLRERILGGVTRSVLEAASIPSLMMH